MLIFFDAVFRIPDGCGGPRIGLSSFPQPGYISGVGHGGVRAKTSGPGGGLDQVELRPR